MRDSESKRKLRRAVRELEAEVAYLKSDRDRWRKRAESWQFQLQRRPTREGEILYVTVPGRLHPSQMAALRDQMQDISGEGKVVVLEGATVG